ncbi:MAG: hypothetical protein JST80_08560 [Bdellovibrionales bacterium]|nr:hypothetical protein [Bdellovibrionales bacterium]
MQIHFTPVPYVLYFILKFALLAVGSKSVLEKTFKTIELNFISSAFYWTTCSLLVCFTLDLFGIPSFLLLNVLLNAAVAVGILKSRNLLDWFKRDRLTWAIYSFTACALALIGSRLFTLPSGDDTSVHSYIIDKIIRHHHLFSALNPVAGQEWFGSWQYIYYPSVTHAFMASFFGELRIFSDQYQNQSLLAVTLLATCASTLFVRIVLSKLVDINSRQFGFFFICATLICLFRYNFPIHPLEEGGFNRILVDAAVNLFCLQHLFSVEFDRRFLALNIIIFPVVLQAHPGVAFLYGIFLAVRFVKTAIMRELSITTFTSIGLSLAFLYFSLRVGVQHITTPQSIKFFDPKPTYSFLDWMVKVKDLLCSAYLPSGEDPLFGALPYFRTLLCFSGIFYFFKNRSKFKSFEIQTLLVFASLTLLLFVATFELKSIYPLSSLFYHRYPRMSEILYSSWVVFMVFGVYACHTWIARRFSERKATWAIASFTFIFTINVLNINYRSLRAWSGSFMGAQRADIENLINKHRDDFNDSDIFILNSGGSHSLVQLHGMFKKEPILQFPECMPVLGWMGDGCNKKKVLSDKLETLVLADQRNEEACSIALDSIPTNKLLLLWGLGGTGPYGSLVCTRK